MSTAVQDAIGASIGRMPSGVYIITAQQGSEKVGMLASWVMQAGFEPPMVTVAISPDRELYKLIQKTNRFSVNIVGKNNMDLMKVFGKFKPDQFESVACETTDYGVSLTESIAVLQCELDQDVLMGDHHLLVARIINAQDLHLDAEPYVHLRKSGFSY